MREDDVGHAGEIGVDGPHERLRCYRFHQTGEASDGSEDSRYFAALETPQDGAGIRRTIISDP